MRITSKRLFAAFGVAVTLAAFIIFQPAAGDTNAAVLYLESKTPNAWITMALAAAGESVNVDYLKSTATDTAIGMEAPILAIAAADEDPRTFPDADLVAALEGFFDGTQIGDAALLNDDIFGVLALIAANEPASSAAVAGASAFIAAHQNADGGWSWGAGADSSTDMTAMAASALLAAGTPKNDPAIQAAVAYLKAAQNTDGGFPSSPGGDSNAASVAWVISFIHALGEDPTVWVAGGNNPVAHLESLQHSAGYYAHTMGGAETGFSATETAYAVVALLGKHYPVGIFAPEAGNDVIVAYRIEGSAETVCEGNAAAPNALALIRIIAPECGFTFDIQELSFGPYLAAINDDRAAGFIGWMYRVNYIMPDVGAADYELASGDDVLWYYGDFEWPPMRFTLDAAEIPSGGIAAGTAEYFSGSVWHVLENAAVHLDGSTHETDANGRVMVTPSDGAWLPWASKEGYVRSAKQLLVVGEKEEAMLPLRATVVGRGRDGGGNPDVPRDGDGISFFVEVVGGANLDFGVLAPGDAASRQVAIMNNGGEALRVGSMVTGHSLFRDHILVNARSWREFATMLASGATEDETISLRVPASYADTGVHDGALTFWAIPAE